MLGELFAELLDRDVLRVEVEADIEVARVAALAALPRHGEHAEAVLAEWLDRLDLDAVPRSVLRVFGERHRAPAAARIAAREEQAVARGGIGADGGDATAVDDESP